jgi:cytochrome P450
LGGYFIPEGVTVTTQAYTLHRSPNAFDEPNNFKPEGVKEEFQVIERAV